MKLVSKPIKNRYTNEYINNKIRDGSQYAVKVSGGFHICDPVKTIHIQTVPNIAKFDTTNALQFSFPSHILNSYLSDDNIILSSQTFLQHIDANSILSFGNFENLYSNYQSFVNESLGHMFSNTSLFSSHDSLNTFDKTDLYNLLNSNTYVDGSIVPAFSGNISILNVNNTLQNIQKFNVFGNRTQNSPTEHFMAGDFFYISDGFLVTLKTDLSTQPMYISLLQCENANRNLLNLNKTYTSNLLIYLV